MLSSLYPVVLNLHAWVRWLILALLVASCVRACVDLIEKKRHPWTQKLQLFTLISCDLTLLLGLLLYAFLSPTTHLAFSDFALAMKTRELRFFAVEHPSMMFVAVFLVHVVQTKTKKNKTLLASSKIQLVLHSVAILLVLIGAPWWRS